ncbi:ABC transporter permease [Streptomyces sp. NBC_01728]|uniref:FtsX-like permease family protein n=1 Tax=unclassified Streptomyces TaxID=2593676 RepID=UPI00225BA66C|nr:MULTISPECIES: ABC transporter permease [unclassified Streptomyces]MCX4461295.1 ABC transporter permease [Streptomyces sp. NBC_01719]MCX4490203.1 ABC transporter permease [Streptomyces sp. NBC_01728]MCX4597036.1 ABC transporter permease [Streptomyces sp. NBC_01549]
MTGGRDGLVRTVLMAAGIGLGVALLLVASCVPTARYHRDERIHHRIDTNLDDRVITPSRRTVLVSDIDTVFRGREIRGRMLEPEGPAAPLPPGVTRFPRAGEMVVSPALRKLLAAPGTDLLRERLDHPITGEVADGGLLGPGEYVFYLGGEHMADGVAGARRLDHFGKVYSEKPLAPELVLLSVVGIVVLLAPVAVFIAAAVRFGGEHRDRRLAALRLVGADRRMTARIAAGETLASALIGVVLGAVLFMIGRQFIELVDLQGLSVFTVDLTPEPVLAALTVAGVVGLSLAVTRLAMNGVAVEPLGVVRHSGGARRRLWWRIAVPVLGLLLLRTSVGDGSDIPDATSIVLVVVGMLALLIGVTAVLPWILDQLTRVSGGFGPLSWQLAVRRLQLSGEASTRSVNGIVVAVAGAIALQTLFTGIAHGQNRDSRAAGNSPTSSTHIGVARLDDGKGHAERYASVFSSTPGVQQAIGYAELSVSAPDDGVPETVRVAGCAQLRLLASLPTCTDGDAFAVTPHGADGAADTTVWTSGRTMRVDLNGPLWKVPHITTSAEAKSSSLQGEFPEEMLLATPQAAGSTAMTHAVSTISITYSAFSDDIQDRLRTTAAELDPSFTIDFPTQAKSDTALDGIRRALLAGVTAVLLLIAASMLLGALEQVRDRKRVLAVLVAFGTPRRTLSRSILWQTALPVAMGLLVAGLVGTTLGSALLSLIGKTAVYDWSSMLAIAGIGAVASVAVTMLTLPTLWRSSYPQNLRYE